MEQNTTVELRCSVMQVRFHRENYSVCLCKTPDQIPEEAVQNTLELTGESAFIAVGYGLPTQVGKDVKVSGVWTFNKKYETTQLEVRDCADYVESGHDAIVEYLSSGILKGVRKAMAEKIYATFGEETLDVLENNPQLLLTVPGIREKKLEGIIASFVEHQDMHMLTRLLTSYGVPYRTIVRIRKAFGAGAAAIVKENPYSLCRVIGIGFVTADEIAMRMGTEPDSPNRITGAVVYTMKEAMNADGHVYIRRAALVDACVGRRGVLNAKKEHEPVTAEAVDSVIDQMLQTRQLVQPKLSIEGIEPDILFLPNYLEYETMSAYAVAQLLKAPPPPNMPEDWEPLIEETEQETGIELADMQREAVLMALSSQFSIITGGPGSGKTTSLRVITQTVLRTAAGARISLAAPTGRAARRMADQTGLEASTIHHLLDLKADDHTDMTAPPAAYLEADLIIIDEASMMDAALFAELLYRIMPGTKVLLLGDADQLPSVGPGNVLRELLSIPDVIPNVKLDKVFRQGEDSIIPLNAAKVRRGETDLIYSRDQFHLQKCRDEDSGANMIVKLMGRLAELGELDTAQVLCPMRRRGATATRNLNTILHDVVNPPDPDKQEITVACVPFREGDKVMQTKNTGSVSNGDIGYVVYASGKALATTDGASDEEPVLKVKFDAVEEPVSYDYESALELEPATAITIHKSQGGEFERVIVPIFSSMSFFLRRNLFYTAITRAKKQVIIVSDGSSIDSAIRHEDTSRRNTVLARLTVHCAEHPEDIAILMEPTDEYEEIVDE